LGIPAVTVIFLGQTKGGTESDKAWELEIVSTRGILFPLFIFDKY